MKITREGDEMVVRVALKQPSYDAVGDLIGDTDNLIGVIAGNECSISQLIDLGYKGDQQEGMPIIGFFGDPDRLRKVCAELDIQVWEHELCLECGEPLRGAFTYNANGAVCIKHEEISPKGKEV